MLQEISTDNYKFVAKLGNLKVFVQLLKAVNFKEVFIIDSIDSNG